MSDGSNTLPPVGPEPGRSARPRPTGAAPVPPVGAPPVSPVGAPPVPPVGAPAVPPVGAAPVEPSPLLPPPRAAAAPQTSVPPPGSEYDETIVATSQIAVSVAIAVVLAVVLIAIRLSLWPFAIIVLLAVGGVGVYLAGVSVAATRNYVEIGQGRGERNPRRISSYEIVDVSSAELTWSQVFGIGLTPIAGTTTTTRLTVRPGPTLVLELSSGEVVRVSTPDPDRAIAALGRSAA